MVDANNLTSLLTLSGMVTSDTGLPDPDNPNEELRVSNEDVILVTDDDEESDDQETVRLDAYQPLPIDEDAAESNHGYCSSDDEASGHQPASNPASSEDSSIPVITPMEEVLVREVWSGPPPKAFDIEMDSKKVDEVKEVMANITLPASSIPEWATNIPEDEWKNQLLKRLQNLQGEKK